MKNRNVNVKEICNILSNLSKIGSLKIYSSDKVLMLESKTWESDLFLNYLSNQEISKHTFKHIDKDHIALELITINPYLIMLDEYKNMGGKYPPLQEESK